MEFMPYAAIVLVVMIFFINYRIFVTPADLAIAIAEVIEKIENKFATKESVSDLKEDVREVKTKVNDIYDFLISK